MPWIDSSADSYSVSQYFNTNGNNIAHHFKSQIPDFESFQFFLRESDGQPFIAIVLLENCVVSDVQTRQEDVATSLSYYDTHPHVRHSTLTLYEMAGSKNKR
ncbi:hypothetical protein F4781DRAFT_433508 [Annulohypoxylon bovei var. microspora]|nr:hypothetical protein F4781DRAFT_433508 [Annulohypoxylon bovei var. microspora]